MFICLFSTYSLLGQDLPLTVQDKNFHYKPVHSFRFYHNNAIYPKAKFTNQNPDPKQGWDPLTSYGAEWTIGYNLTYPSGFGFSLDVMVASFMPRFKNRPDNFKVGSPWHWAVFYPLLGTFDYFGISSKISYINKITPFLFIQPTIGLKFPYYLFYEHKYLNEFIQDNEIKENYMYFETVNATRKFVPDLVAGIDLLFHTKRNPRNNFILGLNLNLGFTPRYKGYYSITPPFTEVEKDCDISIGSTFFGINFGYQFVGLPKTYDRKAVRQERRSRSQPKTFDFNQPVHSFGFVVNIGGNYPNTYIQYNFEADPDYLPSFWGESTSIFVPDLSIKYNCALKKGWGIGIDIPLGMMLKTWLIVPPFALVQPDTMYFDNAIVLLHPEGTSQEYKYRFPYSGLAVMASYLAPIHPQMFIHPQIGVKFVPFLKSRKFDDVKAFVEEPREGYPPNVEYATVKIEMPSKNNAVPDLFIALNFLVNGKKNKAHNFIFGVNAQICFVDRVKVRYQTTDVILAESQSSGWVNFRSTSVGLHLGYMFLKLLKGKRLFKKDYYSLYNNQVIKK
ncbi:MAG: hypothetical protein FWC10_03565 [Lentimicrobiaceae bacterium]|nr:hypothetical protein [Lentimicrobiaceae bacterium]